MELLVSLPGDVLSLSCGVLLSVASVWYIWEIFYPKDDSEKFPERTFDSPVSRIPVTSEMKEAVENNREKAGTDLFSYMNEL